MTEPIVRTDNGTVRGRWRQHRDAHGVVTRHAIFLGLPYAAAPVGAVRFDAPQPAEPWDGTRHAFSFGATPQRRSPYDSPRIPEPSVPGSETLTVNVTTPDPSGKAALPVLVWIHGGGFIGGSPASPWYGGQAFARDGVVTVTISYRLGFEGFGWIDGAVNNRGVLDWIAGLEWVQRNIAAFGGDPARVTIGGQSAGGSAVMRLLAMPSAQHLFANVLAISPADATSTAEEARDLTRRMAALHGIDPTPAGFGSKTELELFHTRVAGPETPNPDRLVDLIGGAARFPALIPALDGDLLSESVADALEAGVGADKGLVIGSTAHEFNHVASGIADLAAHADPAEVYRRSGVPPHLASELAAREPERGPAWNIAQTFSDVVFRRCVPGFATAKGGDRTWAYDFRWESRAPDVVGAAHCVDVPFGFDVLAAPGAQEATGAAPQALADLVHADWLGLITRGAVDAQPWTSERSTVTYGDDASRSVGPSYATEAALWDATEHGE